ncbi:hypothetical protein B0H15DRAFT_510688 [Mycena belliarum]|uniref:Uncharacterized protein n=1 Tax=Mycena belliarum TaxID=1033014 RepID=A0AAD6UDX2_9AGAR|nr:hypothetical protein B0H15DRAFT_510688 [Mycena belliae]
MNLNTVQPRAGSQNLNHCASQTRRRYPRLAAGAIDGLPGMGSGILRGCVRFWFLGDYRWAWGAGDPDPGSSLRMRGSDTIGQWSDVPCGPSADEGAVPGERRGVRWRRRSGARPTGSAAPSMEPYLRQCSLALIEPRRRQRTPRNAPVELPARMAREIDKTMRPVSMQTGFTSSRLWTNHWGSTAPNPFDSQRNCVPDLGRTVAQATSLLQV